MHFGDEHICLLDGMHSTLGSGLGTLLVAALVGDHLFNHGHSLGNREV